MGCAGSRALPWLAAQLLMAALLLLRSCSLAALDLSTTEASWASREPPLVEEEEEGKMRALLPAESASA